MKSSTTKTYTKATFDPFAGPQIVRIIPITQPQSEIWTACVFGREDANRAYNESISLILTGDLDKSALEDAIERLIERHEALQATFSFDGRFMIVFDKIPIKVHYKDISELEVVTKKKAVSDYLSEDANHLFDLVKGPLFKIGLLKLSEQEHQLIITAHHIVCDGWSLGIILEELGEFYSAKVLNRNPDVPKAETFGSYAEAEQEFIDSTEYIKTQQYWLSQFETSTPTVSLPTDFPRPQLRTFNGNRLDFEIDSVLVAKLKQVGIQSRASFVVTLLAAFEVFIYRQTGQDDLALGLPASGQSHSGKTQLIGHCVNLLPLRSKLYTDMTFVQYLSDRKAAIFDAYEHQQFSFGQLLQKLPLPRDPSRVPLIPIMFNIDMGMDNAVSFAGLEYQLKSNPRNFEAFELFLNATGTEQSLILEWSYNSSLFKSDTIKKMMASFEEVLSIIVENPNSSIAEIAKIDSTTYDKLNSTATSYPSEPLSDLLFKQAQTTPENAAIQFGDIRISYEEVQNQANRLSHYLIENGLEPGDFIGVSLPRSHELVITLIAIMKCGAAYLPLDPNFPVARLEYMLKDSEAKFLVTSKEFENRVKSNSKILVLEEIFQKITEYPVHLVNVEVSQDQVAYLLYTSGSTGKPKGVTITHKNLVNFLYSMLEQPGIEETDRLLSITTISFDIAGLELFLPLLKGATLVLADDETAKDGRLLVEMLKDAKITMLQATPTTWQMLLDTGWDEKLPIKALAGGEALPIKLAKRLLPRVDELWNMYGPTETTIWSAVKKIESDDEIISIGKPIANTQIYILNEEKSLVPPGTVGEITIAGDGVARGYWKRPDLTAERFIANPFNDSNKTLSLYHTGDLGKLLPNGELICLGRLDQQVKIRGHRIELEEIEEVLDTLEGIQSAVVIVNSDRLIANLILDGQCDPTDNQIENWKKKLANQLPDYMVPKLYTFLEEFPTTLNGKIDRKALSSRYGNKKTISGPKVSLSNTEKMVSAIWKECLELDEIDIESDFFELGGHSLIAVRVMTLIEKEVNHRFPLSALLEYPTIKELSNFIDKDSHPETLNSLVPIKPEGNKTPLYIVHGGEYNVLIFNLLAKKLDVNQPVYGLQSKGLNGIEEPHSTIEEMAEHYISEIIATNPDGPYALAGHSFGGIVAFEMCKQLRAKGKTVKVLALFDSYVYPNYYFTNPTRKKLAYRTYMFGQIGFVLLNMFSNAKNFKRRVRLLRIMFEGFYLRLKYGKKRQMELQFSRSPNIDKMHGKAFGRYIIEPQEIVVDLFRASENVYFAHDFKYLGWKKLAAKGIRKHRVPGNHNDMFESPNVEHFANSLQETLDGHDSV